MTKALQGKFLDYPDTWLNLRPGAVVEKTFWLEACCRVAGQRFPPRCAPRCACIRLQHRGPAGLRRDHPREVSLRPVALARSARRSGLRDVSGLRPGHAIRHGLVRPGRRGGLRRCRLAGRDSAIPKMLDRGQRWLDWLTRSPFNERGFLLNYDADTGQWKDQDPVSQGQAMESLRPRHPRRAQAARREDRALGGVL